MAIAQVGAEWGVATTASSASVNLPAHSVTSGNNIIVAAVGRNSTAPTAVTPSGGSISWSLIAGATNGVLRVEVWRGTVVTTGSLTITLTPSVSSGMCGSAWEFSGMAASPTSDIGITAVSSGNSASLSIGPSGSTAQGNELVFVLAANASGTTTFSAQTFTPSTTPTNGSTWNATTSTCSLQASWELEGSSTGTQKFTCTLSTTVVWGAVLATFEAAAAATAHFIPIRSTLQAVQTAALW